MNAKDEQMLMTKASAILNQNDEQVFSHSLKHKFVMKLCVT